MDSDVARQLDDALRNAGVWGKLREQVFELIEDAQPDLNFQEE